MNKKAILLFAVIGGMAGGYLPTLFGDTELVDGWTILGSTIGGFLGIWLGVVLGKRFS